MLFRVFVGWWRLGLLIVMSNVIGWDIGGVNTKVARVTGGAVRAACGRPYELQRDPGALVPLLRELAGEVGGDRGGDAVSAHAVTMTAELSQMFRTKRDGVWFVLAAVEEAFPAALVRVYAVDGRFLTTGEARQDPLAVASANWAATAQSIATHHPDRRRCDRRRGADRSRSARHRRAGVHRRAQKGPERVGIALDLEGA